MRCFYRERQVARTPIRTAFGVLQGRKIDKVELDKDDFEALMRMTPTAFQKYVSEIYIRFSL